MLRLLILASTCAIINASIIPNYMLDYPRSLQSLFSAKREVTEEKRSGREVCDTKECKLIANIIKESMDETVDPCDDFYQYACGNWSNVVAMPENATSWSMWDMVQKRLQGQIKKLIQDEEKPSDLFAVKLAKKWYHSCMDEESIEKRGLEPLVSTIWRHGGWPMIMEEGEWDENVYRWQVVDDQYGRLIGRNAFHDVDYGRTSWEGNNSVLISKPHLPIGVRRLVSYQEYMSILRDMDASDENNESGEGSQEKGSKERAEENEEKREDEEEESEDEDDEGVGEWDSAGEPVKKLHKKRVATGHRRRLSQGSKRHNKKAANNHSEVKRKRAKRNVTSQKLLHKILHQLNKANKHKAHGRVAHDKLGHKAVEKHSSKKLNAEENNNKREDEDEESRKSRVMKKRVVKRLGHGKRKSEKHVHGATKRKSKAAETKIQGTEHRRHQKINNHRVHHAANKMNVAETDDDENKVSDEEEESNEIDVSNDEDEEEEEEEEEEEDDDEDDDEEKKDDDDDDEEKKDDEDDDEEEEDDEDDNDEDDDEDEDEDEEDEEEEKRMVEEARKEYREYIYNVSLLLSRERGIEVSKEQVLKDIDDMIAFIIKLMHVMIIDDYDFTLLNTTLKDFQKRYESMGPATPTSKVNWIKKIDKLFYEADVEIDDNIEVLVTSPTYFEKLYELLNETPKRVLVNYVHWLYIEPASMAVTKELADLTEQWSGYGMFDSREELCLNIVQLTNIAGYQYVQEYFKEDVAKAARDMIDDIQKEVEYQIEESKWLSADTKDFVLDKLVHMQNWVGYPEWYKNTTIVKRYFQGLTLGPSFYDNVVNYIRYYRWKNLRAVLEYDNEDGINDMLDPLELNAFFMPTENSISITAADLQSPFFSHNRPWYVNFGIVGLIMGHEVNHGFDDQGHLFDKDGNQMEWLSAMANAYNKRAKCFVDQYNKYSIFRGKNYTVENYGNQTIGENIADTMGMHAVFRAYKRRERECGKEDPALPGLEKFSNNQMFFLSFANLWCEAENEAMTKMQAQYDVHSTSRLRVIGSVSNSEDFAKAFKCPVGSPMNPANKCNIWN